MKLLRQAKRLTDRQPESRQRQSSRTLLSHMPHMQLEEAGALPQHLGAGAAGARKTLDTGQQGEELSKNCQIVKLVLKLNQCSV